ncbi:LysR family transcriptional regulator [Salinisphaera sp.]|uniref:LysR family transcriptional regulator n=1 Tax=Salinisphaera sp. TaxID=1914330 RepID=UPI000C51D349|nr:LysR family transcriptional regulator [Salinisphaera sp.]MBS64537.1 LysR family transcriptional regulator [Salinisphaera sp.]
MDKTTEMTIFVRAVDAGGFSAAARELGLTPSAVSKQIRRLEERLHTRLFQRTTRRIHLTEAGQHYHQRCVEILRAIEEAENAAGAMSTEPWGTLRIAATVSFGRVQVLPLINEFMARYPQIDIEFELTDRHVDLVEDGLDVAIQWREQVDDPDIVARRLCINRRIICAAPAYLARNGTPRAPEDLIAHNCLTLSTLDEFNDWAFTDAEHGTRVLRMHGSFRANTADALHEAVRSGVGLARLSHWLVAPDIAAARLTPVLTEYPHDDSAFFVLYAHRRYLSRKVRAFVDFLIDKFAPIAPSQQSTSRHSVCATP